LLYSYLLLPGDLCRLFFFDGITYAQNNSNEEEKNGQEELDLHKGFSVLQKVEVRAKNFVLLDASI
jgi:hypothetical protein